MGGQVNVCVSRCWFLIDQVVERSISTLLRTCNTTNFGYPLKTTKTCWRWLISWSNSSFVEEMTWALTTNVLSVPHFHVFVANDSQCKEIRYGWIYGVYWSQNCYHSSRQRSQGRRFFTLKWMKCSRGTSLEQIKHGQ